MYNQEISKELQAKAVKWIERMDKLLLLRQNQKIEPLYKLIRIDQLKEGDRIKFSLKTRVSKVNSPIMIVKNAVSYGAMTKILVCRPKFKIGLPVFLANDIMVFKDFTFSDLE